MPRVLVDLLQSTGSKGGIEVYVRELYRALGQTASEFEYVGFASREFMGLDHSWFPGQVIDSGISGENRVTWALGELFAVSAAGRRVRADLIHGPAMFGPPRPAVPVVVTFHDLLYFSNPELMTTRLYTEPVKVMERLGARAATRVITISRWSERDLRRYLHFPADRIDVVPLAGTPRVSAPSPADREPAHFLAVGQRRPHKNFETILEAFARIAPERRPRLTITGSWGEDPLRPIVSRLGLEDHVELLGWVERPELEQLYSICTAIIDASFVTGFGMPSLEAMLDGMPVLLADTEVFREVGGDAALYFDPRDPADLARVVELVTVNPELRRTLAAQGMRHAQSFSWSRVAAGTLESFRAALEQGRRR